MSNKQQTLNGSFSLFGKDVTKMHLLSPKYM